jgi:cytochrome c5
MLTLASACALAASPSSYPEFGEPRLVQGRTVWLGTCQDCHGNPLADAPQVKDAEAWAPRLNQSRAALYDHALSGYSSSEWTEMPARGGNADLSDDAVRAAVDYMVRLVESLDDRRREMK